MPMPTENFLRTTTTGSFIAQDQVRYDTAQYNFKFVGADGSQGTHDSFYAGSLLDIAMTIMNDLVTS